MLFHRKVSNEKTGLPFQNSSYSLEVSSTGEEGGGEAGLSCSSGTPVARVWLPVLICAVAGKTAVSQASFPLNSSKISQFS